MSAYTFLLFWLGLYLLESTSRIPGQYFIWSIDEMKTMQFHYQIETIFSNQLLLVFALWIVFSLGVARSVIKGREFFRIYCHPRKYPVLIGYLVYAFVLSCLYFLGIRFILETWREAEYIAKIKEEFIAALAGLIGFWLATGYDGYGLRLFRLPLLSRCLRERYRFLILTLITVPMSLSLGLLSGWFSQVISNLLGEWNQGAWPLYVGIPFLTDALVGVVTSLFILGLLPALGVSLATDIPLLTRNSSMRLGFGLLVFSSLIMLSAQLTSSNHRKGIWNIIEAVKLKSLMKKKTLVLFDAPEGNQSKLKLISTDMKLQTYFYPRYRKPYFIKQDSVAYQVSEEDLEKAKQFYQQLGKTSPWAFELETYLAFSHLLLLNPEEGMKWLHRAGLRRGGATSREFEAWHLGCAPIREPYLSILKEYTNPKKWSIGSCTKELFSWVSARYGNFQEAQEFLNDAITQCDSGKKDIEFKNYLKDARLTTGKVQGEIAVFSPHASPFRLGLLKYVPNDLNFYQKEFSWNLFLVLRRLTDAVLIDQAGPFEFTDLSEGNYILIALADPESIPADPYRVIIHDPPERIELTRENPVADLGSIVIAVYDEPFFKVESSE